MNTEELQEQQEETLHFDAHEFDGLREALEKEAEGFFRRMDQFIRDNPLLCIGIATAVGFALVGTLGRKTHKSEQPGDSTKV